MRKVNVSELVRLTGSCRAHVLKRVAGLEFTVGDQNAKEFNSEEALRSIYLGFQDGKSAQERLALKKAEQIDLEMEVKRRERVSVEDVEEHQDEVFQNMAGVIKAHEGKLLSPDLVQELFSEMRRLGEVLSGYTKKAGQPDTAQLTEDDLESALAEI